MGMYGWDGKGLQQYSRRLFCLYNAQLVQSAPKYGTEISPPHYTNTINLWEL